VEETFESRDDAVRVLETLDATLKGDLVITRETLQDFIESEEGAACHSSSSLFLVLLCNGCREGRDGTATKEHGRRRGTGFLVGVGAHHREAGEVMRELSGEGEFGHVSVLLAQSFPLELDQEVSGE
jgi:hypothetical protein